MPKRVVQIIADDGTLIEEVSRETVVPEHVNERITETRAARALEAIEAAHGDAQAGPQRALFAAVAALIRRELHYHDRPAPDPDG